MDGLWVGSAGAPLCAPKAKHVRIIAVTCTAPEIKAQLSKPKKCEEYESRQQ
jgi:hypothetical protein